MKFSLFSFGIFLASSALASSALSAEQGIPSLAAVEKAVDEVKLTATESNLAQALGGDDVGTRLKRAIVASNRFDEIRGAYVLGEAYDAEFKKKPSLVLAVIEKALQKLPKTDHLNERAALLLAAARLPGSDEKIQELALEELKIASAGAFPVLVHAVFLGAVAKNARSALEGTAVGIAAQNDPVVRETMASQFRAKFPSMEKDLSKTLASRGIQLKDRGERALASQSEK